MKTKHLFFSVLTSGLFVASSFAQNENITPSKFFFSEKTVGNYKDFVDKSVAGANPANQDADVKTYFAERNGFVCVSNGQFANGLTFANDYVAKQDSNIMNAMQIVDLGGEVGKVFMLKGANSTFEAGTAPSTMLAPTWWNLHLMTDPTKTPTIKSFNDQGLADSVQRATIRMKIVFHIHANAKATTKTFGILGYNADGNTKKKADNTTLDYSPDFTSADFYDSFFDPDLEENIDTYNPNKWRIYEYDWYAKNAGTSPLRYSMLFGGNMNTSTLLIKEISFTLHPTAPITPDNTYVTLTSGGSSSVKPTVATSLRVAARNGHLSVYDVKEGALIGIYNSAGQLVKQAVSEGSVTNIALSKGFYIVKIGGRTSKVAL